MRLSRRVLNFSRFSSFQDRARLSVDYNTAYYTKEAIQTYLEYVIGYEDFRRRLCCQWWNVNACSRYWASNSLDRALEQRSVSLDGLARYTMGFF